MKIGILGAGNVGGALGESWTRHGHEVYFGVRHPEDPKVLSVLKKCGPRARAETPADAVHSSEVVVNALPWPATKPVLESLNLQGRTVLDYFEPALALISPGLGDAIPAHQVASYSGAMGERRARGEDIQLHRLC